ncbi:MAG: DoxX family membrane protein [Trueperaceae bacterium]
MPIAMAHEKWFIDAEQYPGDLAAALSPPAIWFIVGALLVVSLAYALQRLRRGRGLLPGPELFGATPGGRSLLYGLAPMIIGVHLAVPLLIAGVSGTLLAPSVPLDGAWRYLLGLVQTGIALSFFYGGFARPAAVALAVLWLLGFWVASPVAMFENAHFLGFAAFFFLAGRGPFAIDRLIFPKLEPPAALARYAVTVLRIGVGLSFIVIAFTEKLANLPLALAFLERYPLNFTPSLGVPLPDPLFILAAGTVELIIGLLLVFGIFVRETIVVAWLPFNLTLTVFNWVELVGHLPFYGVMALLLIWTARDRELWTAGLGISTPKADAPGGVRSG